LRRRTFFLIAAAAVIAVPSALAARQQKPATTAASAPKPQPSKALAPAAKPAATVTERSGAPARVPAAGAWDAGRLLANVEPAFVAEASGIVASRANPGILWTHNDSGDGAYLYALDRQGKARGVYLVRSATAVDWEDIAWGPGSDGKGSFLYLGDTGDFYKNRTDCAIYRIPEPKVPAAGQPTGDRFRPLLTDEPTVRLPYVFPDDPHDVETVLVHPKTGAIYLITKDEGGVSGVYRFPKMSDNALARYTLERVGTLSFNLEGGPTQPYGNRVTGGDIAPDGRRLVLRTYYMGYEWRLPDDKDNFDDVWTLAPTMFPLPFTQQGEGICYGADGKTLLTTSEKRPTPLYEQRAK